MRTYRIQEKMIRHPLVIAPETLVEDALLIMRENDLRHLPVVVDNELVGLVSERDLKACGGYENRLIVGDVMVKNLFVVTRSTPIADIAREMADGKIGSALVVDEENRIEGIFTSTDALRLLCELLEDQSFDMFIAEEDFRDGILDFRAI